VRKALLDRGWVEVSNKSDVNFSLKFTLNSADIQYYLLKKHQIVNHNRGDFNITCKSGIIESLAESP
jgi:hypothetical protein